MKICLACRTVFDSDGWECRNCGTQPPCIQGHFCFAPELAYSNEGFHESFFADLIDLEKKHFWFRSRNRLIIWALRKYFPDVKKFFEIGCGTGFVLSEIERSFPRLELSGSEIFIRGLQYASVRLERTKLLQMDTCKIPFDNEYDVIGMFDVLEHVEEDELALSEVHRALRKNGGVIITVPQHKFLWSKVDEYSCHFRRYNRAELISIVQSAGFEIIYATSFMTLIMPALIYQRFIIQKSSHEYRGTNELNINGAVNFILGVISNIERAILRLGVSLPFGSSLMLIARKR